MIMLDLEKHNPRYAWRSREFVMNCKVIRKTVSYFDPEENTNHTADLILLDPYPSSEHSMFLTAWLPEEHMDTIDNPSKIELPVWIEGPINMATKVNVKRAGSNHSKPHLLIMPIFMEKLINNNKEITELRIKVFPEDKMEEFEMLMKSYKVLPDITHDEFLNT